MARASNMGEGRVAKTRPATWRPDRRARGETLLVPVPLIVRDCGSGFQQSAIVACELRADRAAEQCDRLQAGPAHRSSRDEPSAARGRLRGRSRLTIARIAGSDGGIGRMCDHRKHCNAARARVTPGWRSSHRISQLGARGAAPVEPLMWVPVSKEVAIVARWKSTRETFGLCFEQSAARFKRIEYQE